MIRVASLKDMVHAKYTKPDIAGMPPKEQLKEISKSTQELVAAQYNTYNRSLLPALKKCGLSLIREHEDLTKRQCAFADQYFEDNVYPVLTPMAMDLPGHFHLSETRH